MIEFNNVSKRFILHKERRNTLQERITGIFRPRVKGEEFWALRNVSFRVEEGQSLGLIGHNGAGKSTILKLMTRILEPTSGTVKVKGRVAALLELGSGFHPDLSGRENVFLNGSLMGFSRREMQKKLDEIIEFSEIGQFIDMEVKHYSSGMYTRLAFAVATAVDPDILITDEVLAVGDEAFQRKCMERIYNFRTQGKTIIFVSHALETVQMLCDIAVWMDRGEVRKVGEARPVIEAYLGDVNRKEAEALRAQKEAEQANEAAEEEQQQEPEDNRRRGTFEVEITKVELLNAENQTPAVFKPHEQVTLRIHYSASKWIHRPVFGVAIHHENGFWLTGPNTRFDRFEIPSIEGTGHIDFVIPHLPLLDGRYLISVSCYDEPILHPYDSHTHMYELVVRSDEMHERYGVLTVNGYWVWNGQTSQPVASLSNKENS